jgi:LysR family transcriptional activator of nhaA
MDKPWLNYHHLYYFRSIAMEGGIVKAAKKLRLGQPTLSTQLKQFEDQLGYSLFERRKKRLYLTEAGRIALDYANEIFRLGDEMQDALSDRKSVDRLEVQFGILDSISKNVTLKMVELAASYRDCVSSIVEGRDDLLLRELKAHRLDLVMTNHPPPIGEAHGLQAKLIGRFPIWVCGTKAFLKLSMNFPASLASQPFIMPTAHSRLRSEIEQYFRQRHIPLDLVAEVQDTSPQKLMAAHGTGLIPITELGAHEMLESKELYKIGPLDEVSEEIWLIAGERRMQNPIAAHLMQDFSLTSIT